MDLREGCEAFRSNHLLWMMTWFVMLVNCSMIVANTTVIFFAKDDLQLSSTVLAIVLSTAEIGGFLGSLGVNRLRQQLRLGVCFGGAVLLNGVANLGLCLAGGIRSLAAFLLLIGFATTIHAVCVYTFRQEQTPAHLMGRISGITGTILRVGMPITMYLSGWMIEWWGGGVLEIPSFSAIY